MSHESASRVARVAVLHGAPPGSAENVPLWAALIDALRRCGWVEGRNLEIHRRWTEGRGDRYSPLGAELVALRPDLIVAANSQATFALQHLTDTIPIVMVNVADPVRDGFVASLERPGGTISGVTNGMGGALAGALNLLREILPEISRLALLWVPANSGSRHGKDDLLALAPRYGLVVELAATGTPEDFAPAFAAVAADRPDALMVHASSLLIVNASKIAEFAVAQRLPTLTGHHSMVRDGLLLAYSPDRVDLFRQAAECADLILRGTDPAELPIRQPTKFELVVNRKTAHAIGLEIPAAILARADEIIG